MSVTLVRVVNEQTLSQGISRDGSILLDKIDESQGNSENPPYAQIFKQTLYVPYWNPADPTVKGYVDLVQTDNVKLQAEVDGSIGGLANTTPARVTITAFDSSLIATAVITSAANAAGTTTIGGTTFLSVSPDVTKVILTNLTGVSQTILQAAFSGHTAIQIQIPDAAVSIGTPATGWTAQVFANSKLSNVFTLT
jgi:hypothetical protein